MIQPGILMPQLQRFVIEKIENMWFTDHLFHEAM